ncbi:MAG: transcriptional regulator, partial [Scytonema sp. PMC 1069.18]|nr:transcriptional regulator [Scytonema sp. PMC 1069.18]MEC4881281.1 transcriptional regulator [Scytonema sp. PMC 1070.18]MEC4882561.1 transcriptional regulator [Scytonema sp. PMC 1070.18]
MTRIFNPESYGKLLAKYQPKTITTEEENLQALTIAQDLEHRPSRTLEEEMLLELLVTLIEKFEETHYPIPEGTPHSMLMHLMEARDITTDAIASLFGSSEIALEIINGERSITKAEAKMLAEYFHVDASLFT